jgi:O-antigen/teichoic acid export membrane protein
VSTLEASDDASLAAAPPVVTQPGRTRNALATLVGSISNTSIVALQAIVLVPLYLHALGAQLYGAWLATGDVLLWLQAFDLGLPNFLIQRVGAAHGIGDERTASEYLATGLVVLGIVAACVALIMWSSAPILLRMVAVPKSEVPNFVACFRVATIAASISIVNNAVIGYSRGVQQTSFLSAATVLAGVLGMVASLIAILSGFGLWSIVYGILVRSGISLIASGFFLLRRAAAGHIPGFKWRGDYFAEVVRVTPATAAGGLGYALSSQSENAIIGVIMGPAAVPVFALTKKLVDLMRSILDGIAFATYGGFAHLVASRERGRAGQILSTIISLRFALAVISAVTYVTVNGSLVGAWVGSRYFGGEMLTFLLSLQFLTTGDHFLVNYLYRASGAVREGSILLAAEAIFRLPLLLGGVLALGFIGIPLAATVSAAFFRAFTYRRLVSAVASDALVFRPPPLRRFVFASATLLCLGSILGRLVFVPHWWFIVAMGLTSATIAGSVLLLACPEIRASLREIRLAI